jgi:NAD(P)-dependent dehydrogenase (short-subunit alcohol dehydrogenase family)
MLMAASFPNSEFHGRVIVITGAAGSLGSAAAKALAGAGAQLVLLDKSVAGLERLSDAIVAAGGPTPALHPLDFCAATESDYQDLADLLDQHFGLLHGLLHSAADLGSPGPLCDVGAAAWQTLLLVNLTAPFLLTRALLPLLVRSPDPASVVFTTDSAARCGNAYWGGYGVAKQALEGLVRMWSAELESAGSVHLRLLAPGPTRSALRRRSHPAESMDQLAPPETLAPYYLQLFQPDCPFPPGSVVEALDNPPPATRERHHVRT